MPATPPDPRPQFAAALDQLEPLLDALGPADLDRPTPCSEYDVRQLLAHLVAVLRKLVVAAEGGDPAAVIDPAADVVGREAAAVREARARVDDCWGAAARLDDDVRLPWGTMTGRAMLDAYTHEFTVHGWDLARAIGREAGLDPVLAERAIVWFRANVSPDERGDDGQFAAEVTAAADADPYTRLAAVAGRSVTP